MMGRDGRPPQRRRDPRDGQEYTFAQFVEYYGDAEGRQVWQAARNGGAPRAQYYVGQKVVALTKLRGNNGLVVKKGTVGEVTAVPGPGKAVKIDPGAVAEVLISGIRFDAQPDMIEPYQSGYGAKSGGGYDARPSGRAERRADPTDPSGASRYTLEEFTQYYGNGKGSALWEQAGAGRSRADEKRSDPSDPKGKRFTRSEFCDYYGEKKGLSLWRQAGSTREEKRADPSDAASKKTYTKKEFVEFHGEKKGGALWNKAGKAAAPANPAREEKRADPNEPESKKKYTKQEFLDLYGKKKGEAVWAKAAPKEEKSEREEKRADPNDKDSKKKYTKQEFLDLYGKKKGEAVWKSAGEAKDRKIKIVVTRGENNAIGWTREDLRVTVVEADGPAAKAGVKPGYKIVAVEGKPVKVATLSAALKAVEAPEVTFEFVECRKDDGEWFTLSQFTEYYGPKAGMVRWKRSAPREKKPKKAAGFVILGLGPGKKPIFA